MYDPSLGRFTTIDPWAEKYNYQSPYLYAGNNPIRFTDYMGLGKEDEVKVNEIANNDDGSITVNETNINTEKNSTYTTDSEGNTYRHDKTTTTTTNASTTIDKDGNIVEDKTTSSTTSSSETVTYREERKTGTSDQVIDHYAGTTKTDPVPVSSGNSPGIAATNISNNFDEYKGLVNDISQLQQKIADANQLVNERSRTFNDNGPDPAGGYKGGQGIMIIKDTEIVIPRATKQLKEKNKQLNKLIHSP